MSGENDQVEETKNIRKGASCDSDAAEEYVGGNPREDQVEKIPRLSLMWRLAELPRDEYYIWWENNYSRANNVGDLQAPVREKERRRETLHKGKKDEVEKKGHSNQGAGKKGELDEKKVSNLEIYSFQITTRQGLEAG